MLVKWGSIIVKGSGKLGGHVFSSGPSGASVHTLAKARNPQTKYQSDIRSRFTRLTQGWRDLTEAQRESWYDAESAFSRVNRFGDVILLSGKNLFESLNNQRLIRGFSVLNIAPMPTELSVNQTQVATFSISGESLTIFGNYTVGSRYQVIGTPAVSQGVRNASNKIRIFTDNNSQGGGTSIFSGPANYTEYVNRFSVPRLGEKIFIGTYAINASGQRTTNSIVQAIINP